MASRDERVCDACMEEGRERDGRTVYLGFAADWWQLDLCEEHEVSLLGDLEALLDSVGVPVSGPQLNL